ncbi:MAG TPA: hypothetical protein VHB77_18290 [Planctomycetaceae bacterium]|nr:hypothetical protein [Planctomycetaceae bacterium]
MKIDCTHCGTEFDALEGPVKCPSCEKVVMVDADQEVFDVLEYVEDDEPESRPRKPAEYPTHIVCPMCAEYNWKSAKVCRFCGEHLTPKKLSRKHLSGVWRDRNQLVMSKDAELPYRCVKTNEPAELSLRRKLSWHAPVIFVTIFAGLLVYVIAAIILSKKADIQVPISRRIQKRRWTAILAGWLLGLGGLAVIILTCVSLANSPNRTSQDAIPFLIIGGIVFVVFSAFVSSLIASIVKPARITDTHVWLKGVHSDYLALLPEWPGE